MHKRILFFWGGVLLSPSCLASPRLFELNGDIQFTGSVVAPTPTWEWHVRSTARTWAQDWDAKLNEGIKQSDGTTLFTYTDRNKKGKTAFLQGWMTAGAASGSTEIFPTITIESADGSQVLLNGNTEKQHVSIAATGQTTSGKRVQGELLLSIESSYAVYYKHHDDTKNYFCESYIGHVGWAGHSVISENRPSGYEYNNSGVRMKQNVIRRASTFDIAAIIKGQMELQAYDVLGGFSSHLSEVQTVWHEVPYCWNASVIANIRIQ